MRILNTIVLGLSLAALAACVPSDIERACKQEAIQTGFGKCSIDKGRQNSSGVWVVKMDCSRGVASCMNDTTGNVRVYQWTSTSEFLYKD